MKADLSSEAQVRRQWNDTFSVLEEEALSTQNSLQDENTFHK